MKKLHHIVSYYASYFSVASVLIIWQLAGMAKLLPKYIMPTPLEIGHAFARDFSLLFFHMQVTLLEAVIGLSIGVIVAWGLAILMDSFDLLKKALYPILIISQTIPTVVLAPILVLWLGYGILPKIVLIVLTTAFPILISILDGFVHCDQDTLMLLKLMKANKRQLLWHVKIPQALSYFYAGLRVSVSYAFIGAVVSEWLGGFEGLGVYMIRAKKLFQYDTMFAIIVLIAFVSLMSMWLVTKLEHKHLKWRYKGA